MPYGHSSRPGDLVGTGPEDPSHGDMLATTSVDEKEKVFQTQLDRMSDRIQQVQKDLLRHEEKAARQGSHLPQASLVDRIHAYRLAILNFNDYGENVHNFHWHLTRCILLQWL